LRSFGVSGFQIIYRIQKNVIEIIAVGPRERICEETLVILKKEATKRTLVLKQLNNWSQNGPFALELSACSPSFCPEACLPSLPYYTDLSVSG
jgi:hypothetical protein